MPSIKYQFKSHIQPTVAPLTAAVGMALGASTLQAAVITVDTLADGSLPGQCTLRDALVSANTDTATAACAAGSGADEIVFQSGLSGTITLTGGFLPIQSEVTISGPGADQLTISGNNVDRVFYAVNSSGAVIDRLRLTDGSTAHVGGGAAVLAQNSTVVLSNCEIADNYSSASAYGGAVTANLSDLTINQCELTGNTVVGGALRGSNNAFGGAVLSVNSQLSISGSLFSANQAGSYGGALALFNSLATVSSSTFSTNQALFGGAISVGDGSNAYIDGSLITLNEGAAGGGLIVGSLATANLTDVDIYANIATYQGGGIQVGAGYASPGPLSQPLPSEGLFGGGPNFSLVGPGNLDVTASYLDGNLTTGYGGGLIAKYESQVSLVGSFISNNIAQPPLPLDLHDGSLLGGGGGTNSGAGGGLFARDDSYLVVEDSYLSGNYALVAGGGALADRGAGIVIYNSTVDANQAQIGGGLMSGFFDSGAVPLRGQLSDEPVGRGASGYNGVVVAANSTVSNNTAVYGGGIASIYDGFTVAKYANITTNDASSQGGGGMTYSGYLLSAGSLFDNNSSIEGGGIARRGVSGRVIVDQSSITGNSAELGGGLDLRYGPSSVKYSTVNDNSATIVGGMIALSTSLDPINVVNSTITNNSAVQIGGLYATGTTLDFVTISHNTASGMPAPGDTGLPGRGLSENPGGAFLTAGDGDVVTSSSIFANNTSPGGTIDLTVDTALGTVSLDYSLIQTPGTGLPAGTGNLIGSDPQLGPLSDNGGLTLTRALPDTSPAVNAADPGTTVSHDQRSDPYPRVFGGQADMGAFEFFIDGIFSDRFEQP